MLLVFVTRWRFNTTRIIIFSEAGSLTHMRLGV